MVWTKRPILQLRSRRLGYGTEDVLRRRDILARPGSFGYRVVSPRRVSSSRHLHTDVMCLMQSSSSAYLVDLEVCCTRFVEKDQGRIQDHQHGGHLPVLLLHVRRSQHRKLYISLACLERDLTSRIRHSQSVIPSMVIGLFSQAFVRKKYPKAFTKYNYLLAGALDGGTQVISFILNFAVVSGNRSGLLNSNRTLIKCYLMVVRCCWYSPCLPRMVG